MSKRRREESDHNLPSSSTGPTWQHELEPAPPLPMESVESLSSSDLSFDPILSSQPLPSPEHVTLSIESQLNWEVGPTSTPSLSAVGDSFHDPTATFVSPPPETFLHQEDQESLIDSHSENLEIKTTAGSFSAVGTDSESIAWPSESNLEASSSQSVPFSVSKQPLPSVECHLPNFSFDDPSAVFGAFEKSECVEQPFYDAVESDLIERQNFLEENDPCHQSQFDEEEAACPALGYVSECFFDTLDSEPLPTSDLPSSDPPLYDGATVSVNEALTAVLTFMLGCRLSGEVMKHLISLLNLLLPLNHKFVTSLYAFHNYFERVKTPLNLIYYCTICTQSLAAKDSVCDKCKTETKVGFYVHVPLIDQIKCLYARPGFVDLLSYRHSRTKKVPNNIEDIYDGSLYQSIAGFLTSLLDITLTWNADGISLYKSSNYQVWPIYFSINELPPELRHKEENLLLGGIAFGYEKPHVNILLKPIYEELKCLEKGVDMLVHGKEIPDKVKCFVLCGTADAPAKAIFMRMTQFNGFHGCHCCYAKGEKSDRTGNVFVYPFEKNLTPRSKEAYHEDLKTSSNGIKGPTYLFWMVWQFFMLSTAIDVMHCVYLGLCRQLFTLWCSSEYFKLVFGENAEKKPLLEVLSKIFCNFKAPHYLDRPPRSLKHVHFFKASEFRTWLYSTALPVFEKYMKEPYLGNFKKLVCGVALLNQESASNSDIELARKILISFVKQFQELYGLRNMSYNVHCVLHLADSVLLMGPLWVSSCFPYENINGLLARLVHGTRYAGCQIQSNLGILRKIPSMIKSLQNKSVQLYCTTVMSYRNKLAVTLQLGAKTFIIGKIIRDHAFSNIKYLDVLRNQFPKSQLNFFFRLKKDGFLYVAEEYARGMRDSSNVICKLSAGEKTLGSIKVFVRITDCQCVSAMCDHPSWYYALVQRYIFVYPFKVYDPDATIFSIVSCSFIDEFNVVELENLNCVCFKMSTDKDSFLSLPLNYREME